MYFLYTVLLSSMFLICQEFSALCFSVEIISSIFYISLFSRYFRCFKNPAVFLPLPILAISLQAALFVQELRRSYIKDIPVTFLFIILAIICAFVGLSKSVKDTVSAITNMCSPLFFLIAFFTLIALFAGKVKGGTLIGTNIYHYAYSIICPPSVALTLTYMQNSKIKKIYPAYVSAVAISSIFLLMDSPLFKSIVQNFTVPVLISAQLMLIKASVYRKKDQSSNT